ncbi:MAG: N-acetylmuramoyl-L-alanine amidase [Candidatus Gracilibacteria bacterium]|nr:N-acetylmuramoyl-L-alanine amidase [Candidatus Gracilibacteria bacterium]
MLSGAVMMILLWGGISSAQAVGSQHQRLQISLKKGLESVSEAPFSFQAFGASEVEGIQVRFLEHKEWGSWQSLEREEEDLEGSALIFASSVVAFSLRSDHDVDVWVSLIQVSDAEPVASLDPLALSQSSATPSGFRIISRREWGADESMVTYSPSLEGDATPDESSASSVNVCAPIERAYPGQFQQTGQVSYQDEQGRSLLWPREYSASVKKIVIHHTAEHVKDVNSDERIDSRDYPLTVRAIYVYHTKSRGWGDIGYHYLVDPDGNVYEGRAGGLNVVAAHVLCQNTSTVGVSVMGNFVEQGVPQKTFEGLVQIVRYLTDVYHINPLGKSSFRGSIIPNIVTHAEMGEVTKGFIGQGATACPGTHLKEEMPGLRVAVAGSVSSVVNAVAYQLASQPIEPEVNPLQLFELSVPLKNTGSNVWNTIEFYDGNPRRVFYTSERLSVISGRDVTIKVPIQAAFDFGREKIDMGLIIDGVKQDKTISVSYRVRKPVYKYEVLSFDGGDDPLLLGEKRALKIRLKNTSNFDWLPEGDDRLQIREVTGRGNNVEVLPRGVRLSLDKTVAVGEEEEFQLDLPEQTKEGRYVLQLLPIVSGERGLKGGSLVVNVPVESPRFLADIAPLERRARVARGFLQMVDFRVENTSNFDWEANSVWFRLGQKGGKQLITVPVVMGGTVVFPVELQAAYGDRKLTVKGDVGLDQPPGWINWPRSVEKMVSFTESLRTYGQVRLTADYVGQSRTQLPQEKGMYQGWVELRNTGSVPWYREGVDQIALMVSDTADFSALSWKQRKLAGFLSEEMVMPGSIGRFLIDLEVSRVLSRTTSDQFEPVVGTTKVRVKGGKIQFEVEGRRNEDKVDKDEKDDKEHQAIDKTVPEEIVQATSVQVPPVRVWLTEVDQDELEISSSGKFIVWDSKTVRIVEKKGGELFRILRDTVSDGTVFRIRAVDAPYLEFKNWDRIRTFGTGINDNMFRSVLEFRSDGGKLIAINELSLDDYMKGIAEVPETDDQPQEKRKVIAVLARSYALHYLIGGYEKFPGKPYNAADSPAIFQKYVGYNFESRSPKWQQALRDTAGEVVMMSSELGVGSSERNVSRNEKVLRAAYFSCTDGDRTKSATEAWPDNEYFQQFGFVFQSVPDPLGDDPTRSGFQACGHQVGLSGYGATQKAVAGENYRQIIEYYYQGVEVERFGQ